MAESVSIVKSFKKNYGFNRVSEGEVLGMLQTAQKESAVEDKEADEQKREVVKGQGRKENSKPGKLFLVKLGQFLAKAKELKDLLVDSDPKVDRDFEFVNS